MLYYSYHSDSHEVKRFSRFIENCLKTIVPFFVIPYAMSTVQVFLNRLLRLLDISYKFQSSGM